MTQNFDISDLRLGQFCDLSIISQWKRIEKRRFWMKIIINALKHRDTGRTDTLNKKNATSDPLS